MSPWLVKAVCWVLATAVSMSILAHGSGYTEFNGAVLTVLMGMSFGLAALFARLWTRSGRTDGIRGLLPIGAVSAVLAVALYCVLPIRSEGFRRTGELVLTAADHQDPLSQGHEIWASVRRPDGVVMAANDAGSSWRVKEDKGVVYSDGAPTSVRWRIPYDAGWELQLLKHPWSGSVDIQWRGELTRLNLYAAGAGIFEKIQLAGRPAPTPSEQLVSCLIVASDIIVGTALLLAAMLLLRSRLARLK